MLWVWIPLRRGVLNTKLCDKVCQWLATGRWFSPCTLVSSTNKSDRHDITEILLKVALNTITITLERFSKVVGIITKQNKKKYLMDTLTRLTWPNKCFHTDITNINTLFKSFYRECLDYLKQGVAHSLSIIYSSWRGVQDTKLCDKFVSDLRQWVNLLFVKW
jgi:hypothetical protein